MIRKLAQIRTRRDAVLATLAITAAAVALAMAMTALATIDAPAERQLRAVEIAAWISFLIGIIFSYWFVDSFRGIVQLKDTVDRLARTDDLTGLDNRRSFLAGAEREISRGERHGEALALLILDLDYFKRINDTHGHRVGDMVLVATAEVLSRCVRDGLDIVGRLGGEEFAVVLARCDEDAAVQAAEAIRAAIASVRVSTPGGEIATTASIGCAPIAAGDTVSAALQRADEALYAAKRGGRNRVATCTKGGGGSASSERAERQRRDAVAREPLKRSA
jgi:diguanylate cyclase (GGDEF)-like protein